MTDKDLAPQQNIFFPARLDSRLHGSEGPGDFLPDHHRCIKFQVFSSKITFHIPDNASSYNRDKLCG